MKEKFEKIIIYTSAKCPNCDQLKTYLVDKGIKFTTKSLSDPDEGAKVRKYLMSKSILSVPYTEFYVSLDAKDAEVTLKGYEKDKLDSIFG